MPVANTPSNSMINIMIQIMRAREIKLVLKFMITHDDETHDKIYDNLMVNA